MSAPYKLPILAYIVKDTGQELLRMQPGILLKKEWETKPDGSVVTKADKKGHKILKIYKEQYFPDIGFVSEEGTEEEIKAGLEFDTRLEADPLDITSGYIGGYDGWSVNVGMIQNSIPIAGAIYFPVKQELYFTGDDGKAYLQKKEEKPIEIRVSKLPLPRILKVACGFHETNLEHLTGREYELQQLPGQYRTCMIARGECHIGSINKGSGGGFNSWDVAGPHAVLRAAGGEFATPDKMPLRYKKDIRLPDHIAGGIDILAALDLGDRGLMNAGRIIS